MANAHGWIVKRGLAACLIVGVLLIGAGYAVYLWVAPPPRFGSARIVPVHPGESFREIAQTLQRAGVVRSASALVLYAELTGQVRSVKPGDYAFSAAEGIGAVMQHLVRGDYLTVTVIIPEGLTVHQIAERLQEMGLVCAPEFEQAARKGKLPAALGLTPLGAEGYLFPATYHFSPRATSNEILHAMIERLFEVLTPAVKERMFHLDLTTRQLLTLASMIEKEAKVAGDRRMIASVFYNRMKLGMPLQSDPTAQYTPEGDRNLDVAAAIRTPSAFNTYDFSGLPPGPIANPGWPSIDAALHPAHTDYLYFVARPDGTHIFSHTYKQQERAIALVRRLSRADADPR